MTVDILKDASIAKAVSNIRPRSERQPDAALLERTYVDTGVLPQLNNANNQILYGRRGTGKSHVLRVLGIEVEKEENSAFLYIDMRLLGSASLVSDEGNPLPVRCVSVFKDLLALIQGKLLDLATDPGRDRGGIEEVSRLAEIVTSKSIAVTSRNVSTTKSRHESTSDSTSARLASNPHLALASGRGEEESEENKQSYTEALRDTVVFAEVATGLDNALGALNVEHLFVLIDEWASIPREVQPYIAEFLKRTFFPSNRLTVKIASMEYRSRFTISREVAATPIGFELGGDITANLDLDNYYVYDRNPDRSLEMFLALLHRHVSGELPEGYLAGIGIATDVAFRSRLFTEPATFTELVRAGEGVVRDFLGIFATAFFRASTSGRSKIDVNSVEEAARDWYETDKSTALSEIQRDALNAIMTYVIGRKRAKMFMLAREHSGNAMIQSLFDLRLIHLISRGYSDKENPGLRYHIYSLDYGTYVDLKRTKAEPESFRVADELSEDQANERIVPFADKRSIRRIILDPALFANLQGTFF